MFSRCMSSAPKYLKKAKKRGDGVDPVLSKLSPSVHLGSVSEAFHNALEKVRPNRTAYARK